MPTTIRPLHTPADYGPLAAFLAHLHPAASVTTAELENKDARLPTQASLTRDDTSLLIGFGRKRLLAYDDRGRIHGYGIAWRAPWTPAGDVYSTIHTQAPAVDAAMALFAGLEAWAVSHGASRLLSELSDDHEDLLVALLQRGYRVDGHVVRATLRIAERHVHELPEAVAECEQAGLRFASLAEVDRSVVERQLYDLYRETLVEHPGFIGELPDFTRWREEALSPAPSEWVQLAYAGPDVVGVSALFPTDEAGVAYTDYTGVRAAYRGRGVARTLKMLGIAAARAAGVQQVTTEMELSNGAMRAVNERLGFELNCGHRRVLKALREQPQVAS